MNKLLSEYYASALIWPRILVIGAVAYIGFIVLGSSSAASYTAPAEVENAAIAGNADPVVDADASAKTAVIFGGTGPDDGQGDRYLAPESRGFMPYAWLPYETDFMVAHNRATGTKQYMAGFINAYGGCSPHWGSDTGDTPDSPNGRAIRQAIDAVRGRGADVAVSFGDGAGYELAAVCPTVDVLQAAYQDVITAYGLSRVSFTLNSYDEPAVTLRRALALYGLQRQNPGLRISVTAQTGTQGIGSDELAMLRQLREAGVVLSGVGLLAFNYAPDPQQPMADRVIAAVNGARRQLRVVYPGASGPDIAKALQVMTMVGRNGSGDVFTLQDAAALRDYILANGIGTLGFWSVARDQPCAGPQNGASSYECSGTDQARYQFGDIFKAAF